jgi:hypothetical protein
VDAIKRVAQQRKAVNIALEFINESKHHHHHNFGSPSGEDDGHHHHHGAAI